MLIPKFLRPAIVFYILISLCGLTQVTGRTVHGSRQDQARTWIHAAMNALGGEDRLRAIHAIEIKGIGFRNELERFAGRGGSPGREMFCPHREAGGPACT
jgi:hypothetical protein